MLLYGIHYKYGFKCHYISIFCKIIFLKDLSSLQKFSDILENNWKSF